MIKIFWQFSRIVSKKLGCYLSPHFFSTIISAEVTLTSGANTTIVSSNASAVKINKAARSLVRFENKNILLLSLKTL
jgi:hypothetical protein